MELNLRFKNPFVIFLLIAGIYSLLAAFLLNTSNIESTLIFRFIPFLMGLGIFVVAIYVSNLLKKIDSGG